ncbi:MAG TPA: cbb3-type cytochrome c oxidase N-terminal domain-containing protein [Chitinophagaceae bacterium]|nr:cbb3-type cytochrome c oxidase N-terminal domain-containing protein [Chitinophagaceae bacterium]
MSSILKKALLSTLAAGMVVNAFAAQPAPAATDTDFTLGIHTVLTACACLLFVVICTLGATLRSAVLFYHQKRKKEAADKSQAGVLPGLLLFLLCSSMPAWAQDTAAVPVSVGDAEMLSWVLYIVLGIEIIIILLFAKLIRFFTGAFRQAAQPVKPRRFRFQAFWTKINKLRPIEEEASLDTGHSYDGIRELDNATPPWFIAGFAVSILFAVLYMWRYHVAQSAPLQVAEYNIEVAEAKARIDEYLKTQANNVDENTVVVLNADGISAGQALFASNCVACHGDKGQGASVGPNLADNYWLHQGGIKDIFKSIKYGWQEKGMKSWKEDFSPTQIAQLASYVHSLKGSNPAGAKEPQGELYEEVVHAADTTKVL